MPEKTFYPWSLDEQALDLSIVPQAADIEGLDVYDYVDLEHQSVNLVGVSGWRTISFVCTINDSNEYLSEVFADVDSVSDCLSLFVVCRSVTTRRRLAIPLQALDNGTWEGVFDLNRDEWAGGLLMVPFAVSAKNSVGPEISMGNQRGRILASGATWAIYLDKKIVMPGGAIDGKWVSFSQHSNPQIAKSADSGWFLDLSDMDSPRLLLNEDVEGFKNALNVTATHGKNASIRNMVSQAFMQQVVTELAMFSIDTLKGVALEESDGWRKDVLMTLAKRLEGESPRHVVNRWMEASDSEKRVESRAEVSIAIQRYLSTWSQTRKAIRTVGDFGDE